MIEKIFKYKKIDFEKLKKYGFVCKNDVFEYQTEILSGEFVMFVYISKDEKISTKILDKNTNEEYFLHLVETSSGAFVGKIKEEYEKVLIDICSSCCTSDVFKGEQAKKLLALVEANFNDKLEFLWEKSPNVAILRRKDSKKWYAVFFNLPKNRLGKFDKIETDIIDIHINEKDLELIDNKSVFPAYHMNKKHWLTICLDSSVPTEKIWALMQTSYDLAK